MALIDLNIHISPAKSKTDLITQLFSYLLCTLWTEPLWCQLLFSHRMNLFFLCKAQVNKPCTGCAWCWCAATSHRLKVLEIRNKEVWCVTTCVSKDYTNFSEPFFHAGFQKKKKRKKKGLLSYVAWNNLLQLFFSFAISAKLSWYGAHPLPLSSICLSPLSAFV